MTATRPGDVGVPDEQPVAFVSGGGSVLAQRNLQQVLPEPSFHGHCRLVAVRLVSFLQQQVAGQEYVGAVPEVPFKVLCRGADVFGRGRDDAVQVLTQTGCLFRAIEDAPYFVLLQW